MEGSRRSYLSELTFKYEDEKARQPDFNRGVVVWSTSRRRLKCSALAGGDARDDRPMIVD